VHRCSRKWSAHSWGSPRQFFGTISSPELAVGEKPAAAVRRPGGSDTRGGPRGRRQPTTTKGGRHGGRRRDGEGCFTGFPVNGAEGPACGSFKHLHNSGKYTRQEPRHWQASVSANRLPCGEEAHDGGLKRYGEGQRLHRETWIRRRFRRKTGRPGGIHSRDRPRRPPGP